MKTYIKDLEDGIMVNQLKSVQEQSLWDSQYNLQRADKSKLQGEKREKIQIHNLYSEIMDVIIDTKKMRRSNKKILYLVYNMLYHNLINIINILYQL